MRREKIYSEVINLIQSIHGYSRFREGVWPVEFNVSLDESADFEDAWALFEKCKDKSEYAYEYAKAIQFSKHRAYLAVKKEWNAFNVWQSIQGDMVRDLFDSDTYSSCSPDVYAQWGIKDSPFFSVKYSLQGCSGKHLCIDSFEGIALKGNSTDDFIEAIESDKKRNELAGKLESGHILCDLHETSADLNYLQCDDCTELQIETEEKLEDCEENYSIEWLRKLGCFLTEAKKMFSQEAVNKEFNYKLLWYLGNDLDSAIESKVIQTKGKLYVSNI